MASNRKSTGVWIFCLGFLALILLSGGIVAADPHERSYKFVSVDHPIDLWQSGSDRWVYYMSPKGTVAEAAEQARKELAPLGFKEDSSQKPWIRFIKDRQEVLVCRHWEFGIGNDGKVIHLKLEPQGPGVPIRQVEYPCVLVKNGPGTGGSMIAFQLKKLVHGW